MALEQTNYASHPACFSVIQAWSTQCILTIYAADSRMTRTLRRFARSLEVMTVLLLGMMAGFFFAFAADVVPAMANLDGTTYVTTQQWINRVVRNALFGSVYFGSTLMPFLTGAAVIWSGKRLCG
jgi:hypothetical protein